MQFTSVWRGHPVYMQFTSVWRGPPVCMQFTSVWRGRPVYMQFTSVWRGPPVYRQFTSVWRGPLFTCSLLQFGVVTLFDWLFPINVKKGWTDWAKFFSGPAHNPREVYVWSKLKNFTPKIMSTFINFENLRQFKAKIE